MGIYVTQLAHSDFESTATQSSSMSPTHWGLSYYGRGATQAVGSYELAHLPMWSRKRMLIGVFTVEVGVSYSKLLALISLPLQGPGESMLSLSSRDNRTASLEYENPPTV